MEEIINKVAQSGLVSFDLEEYYPQGQRALFDIKGWLYEELILKEKDFRAQVKTHDWSQYKDQYIALCCSTDAIVPTWAYMLLTTQLEPYAKRIVYGDLTALENTLFNETISHIDINPFKGQRVVIKGCSNLPVPIGAYVAITQLLRPHAQSIMYGEPCSTVPIYKKKD
jgi:hypothetical protein